MRPKVAVASRRVPRECKPGFLLVRSENGMNIAEAVIPGMPVPRCLATVRRSHYPTSRAAPGRFFLSAVVTAFPSRFQKQL